MNKKILNIDFDLTADDNLKRFRINSIYGAGLSCAIHDIFEQNKSITVVITSNQLQAQILEQELTFLVGAENVYYFPDWETLPYDTFSPYQDIISQRLEVLSKIETASHKILIINVNTMMGKIAPQSFINNYAITIKEGDIIDISTLRNKLSNAGYLATKQVFEHGEFSLRGSIVDLFPMGSKNPFRLDFFDNEIDSISIFDLESQRSIKKIDAINMLPAHEFPTDENAINYFRQKYRKIFTPSDIAYHNIYQQISNKVIPAGIEYYLPLFHEKVATIFDYLPTDSVILCCKEFNNIAEDFFTEITSRANRFSNNPDHPSLPPKEIYLTPNELQENISKFKHGTLYTNTNEKIRGAKSAKTTSVPPIAINNSLADPLQDIKKFIDSFKGRIIITGISEGRVFVLQDILQKVFSIPKIESFIDFLNSNEKIAITEAPFSEGFIIDQKIAVLTESEILGTSYSISKKRNKNKVISPDAIIKNLAELKIKDRVVHEHYGIAEYQGLEVLKIQDIKTECVKLLFANDAKMYIPITSLHLLSKYTGSNDQPLSKLGSESWKKARNKAAEKIKDIAANLLDIYAKRAIRKGYKYSIPKDDYAKFEIGFGYQPTEDQEKAFAQVIKDMTSDKPMDRLVCGDVGFGKTEVAMRAAFIAACNGKQVAILVPTTLLAEQHFESFRDRFAHTPLVINCISRFKSTKEQKNILENLSLGKIDIIIGTHTLLGKNVNFKNLGLLIVDEEHRFGVSQKEKIKKLRSEIDILTMTATPIPRTLNMAINGIRDLSIIATPPAKRLAVKTFVNEYDDQLVREAVLRELKRGGQTYFLHNDVDSIDKIASDLSHLIPEAKIAIAHAQLSEKELARIMHDFYHQRFNLLVCSTIIETGLNIPTANTIIIDRADKLGLAQLHQLRGRVGRSHHQAYAYLMTIPSSSMTNDAKKRLQAIAALEELGSGFTLATHDLEIRGAGEILGSEQSGQIDGIGFNLYMDMLEAAIEALKEGKELSLDTMSSQNISLELHIPALFPENYIFDINTRLSLYKRLTLAQNFEQINDIKAEIIDRFGLLPKESNNLINISKLKIIMKRLGIEDIEYNNRYGSITFGNKIHVKFEYLTSLITNKQDSFKLEGASKLKIVKNLEKGSDRLEFISQLLTEMDDNYEA
ncbi:MAG: transcription-repair coupling factor [Succinivibrionaceae bacterium]